MEVVTTYTCEVCGKESKIVSIIKQCEAQRFNPKFSVGDEIEFLMDLIIFGSTGYDVLIWMPGRILSVAPERGTHKPNYYVGTPKEFGKVIHSDSFNTALDGSMVGFNHFLEERIRKPKKVFIFDHFAKAVRGERNKPEEKWRRRDPEKEPLIYFS